MSGPRMSTTTCTWWWATTTAPRPRRWAGAPPISLADIKIVAADSHTLAPPLYVSGIPAGEAAVLALIS